MGLIIIGQLFPKIAKISFTRNQLIALTHSSEVHLSLRFILGSTHLK